MRQSPLIGTQRGPRHVTAIGAALLTALTLALTVSACGSDKKEQPAARPHVNLPGIPPLHRGPHAAAHRPNIVFVLTDDLAWNLVRYMPHVLRMERHGVTFRNYFVTDSLCCPSRSSIFTGRYPHDTQIFQNGGGDGGFSKFKTLGEEQDTFAASLQPDGYRTALMGKYLNGYHPGGGLGGTGHYWPPYWSQFDVGGEAYSEFGYHLNENGKVVKYGHRPKDYLTDVIAKKGVAFIRRSAAAGQPFMLELATFAPHAPYTPAPRDRRDFRGVIAARSPAFNTANTKPPSWLDGHPPLGRFKIRQLNRWFRKRTQAVQAVDRMIGMVERTLARTGQARNTYIVFSSDNGYHMGEHRLLAGKLTAFDTDIRVPLVVAGPHVPAGKRVDKLTENVDLFPTFVRLAGITVPDKVEGRSLVPLIHGKKVRNWRQAVLVEHHGPDVTVGDPDYPNVDSGNPTSYEALRTAHGVYVEYVNGEREFYDLASDPFELHNAVASLTPLLRERLHRTLNALKGCHDALSCWAAAHIR